MPSNAAPRLRGTFSGFNHQALLYAGEASFVEGTVDFVRAGVAAGEPVQVAVAAAKIDLLRRRLGDSARLVQWTDMSGIGGNPARIIPLWLQFMERNGGRRPARGIGEPIWPGRTPAALVESQHHEALLNLALAGAGKLTLLCPYDVAGLPGAVIDEARRSHPVLVTGTVGRPSNDYRGLEGAAGTMARPLPEPDSRPAEIMLDELAPLVLRSFLSGSASRVGLSGPKTDDLLLAVMAVAQGLGGGDDSLRTWIAGNVLICEIRSQERIDDPLAGREWPPDQRPTGRGLWVANQLCDLVQWRRQDSGTVVRLHMAA
jgi:hypothetical protein